MEVEFSALEKSGTEGIEKANDSIGLEAQEVDQIKSETGVKEKILEYWKKQEIF